MHCSVAGQVDSDFASKILAKNLKLDSMKCN